MNTSVIIAVVILYEIVSIGGCALYLKMKERKHKGGQNTAGDDFSTGGQSMTWPVVGASLALSLDVYKRQGGFITGICSTIILMQVPKLMGGTAGVGEFP